MDATDQTPDTEATRTKPVALVIDDSPALRRSLVLLLENSGLFGAVRSAGDGLSGLAALRTEPADIVLCDLHMSHCGGLEFLRLKASQPSLADIPVLMLTGDDDLKTKIAALEGGACDYVSKSAPAAEMRARIGVHLKLKQSGDELRRQRAAFEQIARVDALTGLATRRALDELIEQEVSRSTRYARPMSVVMIDLDHFKQLNDRYGHAAGDHVLREVAATLRRLVRQQDTVARYGGEELTVVLPETSMAQAAMAAERLRAALADLHVEWRGQRLEVRASLGVAGLPELCASSPAELLRLADRALYRAKAAGRNRVALGRPDSGPVEMPHQPRPD